MVGFLVATLYIVFFALALFSPFLPLALLWRCVALAACAFAAARLLEIPVHWSGLNVGHTLGLLLFVLLMLAISVVLAIRIGIAAAHGRLTRKPLPADDGARWGGLLDRIILAFAGGVAGLACAIFLAFALGGVSGGSVLDIAISVAAAAVAIFMVTRRTGNVKILMTAFSSVLAVISIAGSGQPRRVIEEAEIFAHGRPWCLVVPALDMQVTELAQLGFFSLAKGDVLSHLVVLVRDGEKLDTAHWSIRKQRFVAGVNNRFPFCLSRTDYADALKGGRLKP